MTGDTSKKQKAGSERRAIQNREAQRAFRQRKLQRIKDLESQVASLSAGTSGSVSPLKATHCNAPTMMMDSNAELSRLRQLVSELQAEAVRLRSKCNSFKTIIKNTSINNIMTHSAKTSTTVITSNTISNCGRINSNRTDTIYPQQMTNTEAMIASFH
ncbi:hypothetical protein HDU80_007716 [Chytriomyces hyalinus]|nr:hypothetical protein HDU80_007716 [Chytriomyces hyalinus]